MIGNYCKMMHSETILLWLKCGIKMKATVCQFCRDSGYLHGKLITLVIEMFKLAFPPIQIKPRVGNSTGAKDLAMSNIQKISPQCARDNPNTTKHGHLGCL